MSEDKYLDMSLVIGKKCLKALSTFYLFDLTPLVENSIKQRVKIQYPTVCQRLTHEVLGRDEDNLVMISSKNSGKSLGYVITILNQLIEYLHPNNYNVIFYSILISKFLSCSLIFKYILIEKNFDFL